MDLLSMAAALGSFRATLGSFRLDPHLGSNFYVSIYGLIVGQFQKVSGLESSIDVHEFAEGGLNEYTHRAAGPVKYERITLSHGVTDLQTMYKWYEGVAKGVPVRTNMTIMVLDSVGFPVMWWDVKSVLPVRWVGPSLDAGSSEVAVESIELIHNGISKSVFSDVISAARVGYAIASAIKK
jgi:phage tail-like protein